jgi:hypothetical protein
MGGTGMMVGPGGEGSPVFGAAPGGWMIDEVPDVDLSPDDEP